VGTPIADMVEKLLSTGIPPEAIVVAVRAAEEHAQALVSADPVAAKRRAYDRNRKRSKKTGNSTGQTAQKEKSPTPSKEKLPHSSEDLFSKSIDSGIARARRNPRATRLPDDWQPTIDDLAKAREILPAEAVPIELEKFRDHWLARAGPHAVKANWSAAWRNWCRKAPQMNGNGNGQHRNGNYQGSRVGGLHRLAAELRRADHPS
jgi:hypothetical protein